MNCFSSSVPSLRGTPRLNSISFPEVRTFKLFQTDRKCTQTNLSHTTLNKGKWSAEFPLSRRPSTKIKPTPQHERARAEDLCLIRATKVFTTFYLFSYSLRSFVLLIKKGVGAGSRSKAPGKKPPDKIHRTKSPPVKKPPRQKPPETKCPRYKKPPKTKCPRYKKPPKQLANVTNWWCVCAGGYHVLSG